MGNAWWILPSPRPLLIWLGADALSALALAGLALTLLALWRRPARPWRLGVAALSASWLGLAATLRVLRAYNDVKIFNGCASPDDCALTARTISDTVLWVSVVSVALVAVTLAALLAATILSALEGRRGEPGAWLGEDWRLRLGEPAFADFFASGGALLLTQGVCDWIQSAPLADPVRAGDGLGQIPLIQAFMTTTAGAVIFTLGALVTLSVSGPLLTRWTLLASEGAA
jgi:hypothetical protein